MIYTFTSKTKTIYTMISLIMTALGIAGATASGVINSKQLSRQRDSLNNQLGELSSWYNQHRSEDILDNSQVKTMVKQQMTEEKKRNETLANTVSKGSITPEKQVALASANNINWGEQISKVAQQDFDYKQQVERAYRTNANEIQNNIYALSRGQSDNIPSSVKSAFDILEMYKSI